MPRAAKRKSPAKGKGKKAIAPARKRKRTLALALEDHDEIQTPNEEKAPAPKRAKKKKKQTSDQVVSSRKIKSGFFIFEDVAELELPTCNLKDRPNGSIAPKVWGEYYKNDFQKYKKLACEGLGKVAEKTEKKTSKRKVRAKKSTPKKHRPVQKKPLSQRRHDSEDEANDQNQHDDGQDDVEMDGSKDHGSQKPLDTSAPEPPQDPEFQERLDNINVEDRLAMLLGGVISVSTEQKKGFPFLKLPFEVRERIYRYILVANEPIRVYCKWTKLLRAGRGHKTSIETAIMRTSKQVADECVVVLYSFNVFEYILRDPVHNEQAEEADVAQKLDDAYFAGPAYLYNGDEDDSDGEYEEPSTRSSRHSRSTARKTRSTPSTNAVGNKALPPHEAFNPDVQINITKFGHHFRHIRILAERNRSSTAYRGSMAQAINVFRTLFPRRARLHTITIEVSPERMLTDGPYYIYTEMEDEIFIANTDNEDSEDDNDDADINAPVTYNSDGSIAKKDKKDKIDITFTNFFEKSGSVMSALRGLPCQFIKILVHTEDPSQDETIVVNMRPAASIRRAKRGERDVFAGDEDMQSQRDRQAGLAQRQLDTMPRLIQQAWMKHAVEEAPAEGDGDGVGEIQI